MEILTLPLLAFAVFAIGAGRCALLIAPLATGVAIFRDTLFAGVDVSPPPPGLWPSPLATLAQMPWTVVAILTWLFLLVWVLMRRLGCSNVLADGYLFKGDQ